MTASFPTRGQMMNRWMMVVGLFAASCTEPYPPSLFESTALRSPIGVNDDALYYVTSPNNYDLELEEMSLDGTPRGRVSDQEFVFDVEVRGSRIEWFEALDSQRILRSTPTGIEMAELPAELIYDDLVFGPAGTVVMGRQDNTTTRFALWGATGVEQLPIESAEELVMVGVDATHVYAVRFDILTHPLVRYPLAGGPEDVIASDVISAALGEDTVVYSTTAMLVERSLVDDSVHVLSTSPPTAYGPIVLAGDVVFWGNMRVMDGKSEEFLLPASGGFIASTAANSTDVYWVSSMRTTPLLLGDDGDYKLHRAPLRGTRPF